MWIPTASPPKTCKLRIRIAELEGNVAVMQAQLDWLRRRVFGPGQGERLDRAQLLLGIEVVEKPVELVPQQVSYERAPSRGPAPIREDVFAKLPIRETVVIEPPAVQADPDAFERIGEERTFEVEITPPAMFKREIVRPKYRSKSDRSLPPVIAPAPKRAVAGGHASAGLLAWIALSKYVDHLPLYRLEQMSARWGVRLTRQTMSDWIAITTNWLEPIWKRMAARLLAGDYLQVDETPVRCRDPNVKGRTTECWLWVMSDPIGEVVFTWRESRRHEEAATLLRGFRGLLQGDGYAAYDAIATQNDEVERIGCWAHTRRYFHDALAEEPKVAGFALRLIGQLYRREREWDEANVSPGLRARGRVDQFQMTLSLLHRLALHLRTKRRPKSQIGEACTYLLNQWSTLVAHVYLGRTRLDTNLVENSIRPSALGKKNWLFIGHPEAGQRSAILYSIVVSCRRFGHDPFAYLRDVLTRLPNMTNQDDLDDLLPSRWKPAEAAIPV